MGDGSPTHAHTWSLDTTFLRGKIGVPEIFVSAASVAVSLHDRQGA